MKKKVEKRTRKRAFMILIVVGTISLISIITLIFSIEFSRNYEEPFWEQTDIFETNEAIAQTITHENQIYGTNEP